MSPGAGGVEKHEDVGGAISHVLVVDACRLPWFRGDGHARLADKLARCLVEADHWAALVQSLSVKLKDVFHPGDELGVDLRDAPHLLLPRLQLLLRQPATDSLGRERFVRSQPHHFVRQQLASPIRSTCGRLCTCSRDEQRLLSRRELSPRAWSGLLAECLLQTLFNEPPFGPIHGRCADRDIRGDLLVGFPCGRRKKNLGALDSADRSPPAAHQTLKLLTFLRRQCYAIA